MPSAYGHEIHHHEIHHDTKPSVVVHPSKPTSSTLKGLVGKFLAATAKASASASAHASSVVAHKTADVVSHLGKAVAVGSAAASASLSSSKEPQHYSEYYPTSHESYEYDTSGSSNEPQAEYSDNPHSHDNQQESTDLHNVYPTKHEHLFSTIAALRSGKSSEVQANYEAPTDSYGKPLHDHLSTALKQSVTGNSPMSFKELNMDSLNMYSAMNDQVAQFPSKTSDFAAPSMHLSIAPSHATQNAKPHLYFGVNLPLDETELSNTNHNSFLGTDSIDYGNQFNHYGDSNPALSTKHIEFDANNPDLFKLLGPSSLVDLSKTNQNNGFLPTPATHYDIPDFTHNDNIYTSSLRSNKRKRSPSRYRKLPRYNIIKTVGYEIGPHGRIKL